MIPVKQRSWRTGLRSQDTAIGRIAGRLPKITPVFRDNAVAKPRKPGAGGIMGADIRQVRPVILCHIIFQGVCILGRPSFHKRPVVFAESLMRKLAVQFPGGKRGFCEDEYALHRLV